MGWKRRIRQRLLGRSQAVRHGVLVPACGGSIPPAPAHTEKQESNVAVPEMRLFSGSAHPELAEKIAAHLGIEIGRISIKQFSDGEFWVKFQENIRDKDVFLLQPTHPPADNLLELLIMIDAARRSSAARITAVVPYFGYARQDRKDQPRVAITARMIADLFQAVEVERIMTMDLHTAQIQGFFTVPVDHLYASYIFFKHFDRLVDEDLVIVSPDVGGINAARAYSKRLNASLAIVDKRRDKDNDNKPEIVNVIGEVEGKRVLIIDDIVDTAGTLCNTIDRLVELGCGPIHLGCTHPILSKNSVKKLQARSKYIEEFVVSDTIPLKKNAIESEFFTVLSTAEIFSEAILRIHAGESLSVLFL